MLTPYLLQRAGPHVAFGVPGVLMLVATWVFWLGRHRFVHVPPGGREFLGEALGRDTRHALGRLAVLYVFVALFWALYDQTGSAWVLQAQSMNRRLFGLEWHAAQVQAVNPVLILLLVPLFSRVVYPGLGRFVRVTTLRKIGAGLALASLSFLVPAWVEAEIARGHAPSIAWHVFAYVLITAAEVLVSVTFLEFSYTQAPRRMKSVVMACYFLSVSLGNVFTSLVNLWVERSDSVLLEGPGYYLFFAGAMAAGTAVFAWAATRYHEVRILQDDGL